MDNIATKFEYLKETKNLIKQAIIDKGVTVSDTDSFRSYADKIAEIASGGSQEIPSGFTKYDYLDKTSGTGYLDLNFKATNNTKIQLKFMILSYNGTSANGLFGYYSTSATERYILTTYSTSAAIPRAIGTNLGTLSAAYNTSSLNTIYEIELSKDGYYVNGEQIAGAKDVGNITTPSNCFLYKANNYSTTSFLRVYSLKVYESDKLIHDFVPAKRNDIGKSGLFDKVSGVFNAVSTATGFSLGNE